MINWCIEIRMTINNVCLKISFTFKKRDSQETFLYIFITYNNSGTSIRPKSISRKKIIQQKLKTYYTCKTNTFCKSIKKKAYCFYKSHCLVAHHCESGYTLIFILPSISCLHCTWNRNISRKKHAFFKFI